MFYREVCGKKYSKVLSLSLAVGLSGAFSVSLHAKSISDNITDNSAQSEQSWSAEAGLGHDSNIYRAPSEAYTDYAKSAEPLIDPVIQSGSYIPLDIETTYTRKLDPDSRLLADYRFKGRFYTDSQYGNANQYNHRINIGHQYVYNRKAGDEDSLYAGALWGYKKHLYLDRDTGDEQEFAGADVSGRYTYDMIGGVIELKKRTGTISYDLEALYRQRDYKDTIVISEYDHNYYRLGGDVKIPLAKATRLRFGYDYYVYDYRERPSRNELGDLLKSNPARKYEYTRIKTGIRHRFNDTWLGYLDYERKERTDDYQNYDHYVKDLVKARVYYRVDRKNKVKLSVAAWERDYPNAFAFDNFLKTQKQYDGITVEVNTDTILEKDKTLHTELKYVDENSTDLRYQYDRILFEVSLSIEY